MALAPAPGTGPLHRYDALLDRAGELQGQRNAVDVELVDVVRQLAEDDLWGYSGAGSLAQTVAWKLGCTPARARSLVAVARRYDELPRCVAAFRAGRLSLDQIATIAERIVEDPPPELDAHLAELAEVATVSQLRTAMRLERPPSPEPEPAVPQRSISHTTDDVCGHWHITLPHAEDAAFEAALQSHLDALVAQWKRDHGDPADATDTAPPFPTKVDAVLRLVEAGWDADVAARPHGQRTTVVLHLDLDGDATIGQLHLGPALSDAERRYLSCDSTVEVWFERDGVPMGCGRESRGIPRRLRRALERRDRGCVVPGCGATHGLHAHHLWHWEDGGPTELWNLVLACPHHHRAHHRGLITIRGPAERVTVTDLGGRVLTGRSVVRPPTSPPPDLGPYVGPTGETAEWKWYSPVTPWPGDPPNPN